MSQDGQLLASRCSVVSPPLGVGFEVEGKCAVVEMWTAYYRAVESSSRARGDGDGNCGSGVVGCCGSCGGTGQESLLGRGGDVVPKSSVDNGGTSEGGRECMSTETGDIVDAGAVCNSAQPSLGVRGKHYLSNRRKRLNRKSAKVVSCVNERVGFFSGCSVDVQQQLRESRAKMLVAQNDLKTQQSLAAVKEVQMLKDTRVNEVDFELKRLTLEEKLSKISEKRGIVQGTAQTVVSSTISSSPVTLLGGSVSPSSSISMAEERKLRQSVVDQADRLKKLEAELVSLKTGASKTFKNKTRNVSEWTFKSPYDNFTVDGVHKSKLPGYVRNADDGTYSDSHVDGGQDFQFSPYDC